ncbi:MAG: ORF6N domain-containing protein [Fibrobacter sp.]|nr:ORF6N domain-containing protein [Fibrobacter sp.]
MAKNTKPVERMPGLLRDVKNKIIVIRNQNVIIDADVACLYGVETKRINGAVRNNPEKFPETYMFQLDSTEAELLRSKFSSANFL